jgi:hypothetical protein
MYHSVFGWLSFNLMALDQITSVKRM